MRTSVTTSMDRRFAGRGASGKRQRRVQEGPGLNEEEVNVRQVIESEARRGDLGKESR